MQRSGVAHRGVAWRWLAFKESSFRTRILEVDLCCSLLFLFCDLRKQNLFFFPHIHGLLLKLFPE